MTYFDKKADEVLAALGSDARNGLSAEQVRENAEKFGRNEFTRVKRKSLLARIWEAATEPMLILLLFAWLITIAVNVVNAVQGGHFDWAECAGILVAILISVVLTVVMEGRSAKAFEELNKIKEGVEIKVVRGGIVQYVPQQELVVGDVVYLETGNKAAADGRLLESSSLTCDESSLTGESVPVEKDAAALLQDPETPVAERVNMVYSGTFITGGTGKMVVTDVGDRTQFGLIAREIQKEASGQTPLQEKMGRLGKLITIVGGVFAALIFIIQLVHILTAGEITFTTISGAFIESIVLMVAAVPEGLPTIVAISLSINIAKMAKQNALVKKMVASETVGCINVICSDKTGTLTENRMSVVDVWQGGGFTDKSAVGEGMLRNFCINSTADLYEEGGAVRFVGNPTEGALLIAARGCGADYKKLREGAEVADLYPFSSDLKNMTSVVREGEGYTVFTKGSPEKILRLCNLPEAEKKAAEEGIVQLQKRARRVFAFAHKRTAVRPASRGEAEADMTFDGFVGIADPLRAEVYDAVHTCKTAGIEVKMLTGDNIVTATAIAEELHILDGEHIAVEASYLEALSDEEFSKVLPKVRVIARSTPLLKMRVVKELKAQGSVVAVTCDGINDAPALKNADVGIAMGISGTEVSKEAADIVLLNDSFSTIVTAVQWGRGIYENFKRFIQFQLTVNVAAVLIVFLCTVLETFGVAGFDSPFSALDLLWINIIMDGPPALTLGLEPIRGDLMQRRPTPRGENILSGEMMRRIAVGGVYMTAVCLLQMGFDFLQVGEERMGTVIFTLFVFFQLFNAFNCRELGNGSIFPNFFKNKLMLGSFAVCLALQVLITQFGGAVFGTVPLDLLTWLKVVGMALSVIAIEEIVKLLGRAFSRRRA